MTNRQLHQRQLGSTGIHVSEIGFGAWGIGGAWGERNDADAINALHIAIDHGINFVDTAMGYGNGHSEHLIGKVLAERTEPVTVATKVSPQNQQWPARADTPVEEAYPVGHLRECTEASLRRLGVETIGLQQMHVWAARWLHEGEWRDDVADLKKAGKIRAFGVSITDHEPDTAIELVCSGLVDTVQVIHNIFDQSPQDRLYEACTKHQVGVIVRVALDEGALTGTFTPSMKFAEGDWRRTYFRGDRVAEVVKRVEAITKDLSIPNEQMAETSLRYVLSHDAVSTVIVGMRSKEHVRRNVRVADGKGLPADQLEKLRAHRWNRNFYRRD